MWKSGGELAKFIINQGPEFWANKRVAELGCGCGMAGLTAAAMGAAHVLLTDQVTAGADHNLSANVQAFPAELGGGRVNVARCVCVLCVCIYVCVCVCVPSCRVSLFDSLDCALAHAD